ncbi:MAG: LysR family transcriptional regulator [Hydrogenophaga sp.]|uniref:LysR substrate-binding domain-containing protein n=1 Tax=Hydrogenophaga sp. TaxID=1904254 RepID=UPI0025BC5EC7|nr:LysR substrate-binding domain-containing protein [Hydrogenophaga sp.]MBU7572078.1 LysR family transcriptional regulator [Hydrogenophaga sp.]
MRLTQLRSFYAVARMGSFTKAAEHLHVSQPTITTQVRFLEESYKVELFHRSGRRVQLTQLGEQLMQLAQNIFSLEGDAVSLLRDAGELRTGQLRVAAVGPYHVTRMLADFSQHYPDIKVSVSTGNSQDVLDRLLDYRADVGVLAQLVKDDRFLSVPFSRHPVGIFTASEHRFARRRSIRLAELQGERMILREQGSTTRKALEQALNKAGVAPEVVMEISSREVIREAVSQGIGIAAVSTVEFVPGPGLHLVSISDADIFTYAHVLCLAERRSARMVHAFFETVSPPADATPRAAHKKATRR